MTGVPDAPPPPPHAVSTAAISPPTIKPNSEFNSFVIRLSLGNCGNRCWPRFLRKVFSTPFSGTSGHMSRNDQCAPSPLRLNRCRIDQRRLWIDLSSSLGSEIDRLGVEGCEHPT